MRILQRFANNCIAVSTAYALRQTAFLYSWSLIAIYRPTSAATVIRLNLCRVESLTISTGPRACAVARCKEPWTAFCPQNTPTPTQPLNSLTHSFSLLTHLLYLALSLLNGKIAVTVTRQIAQLGNVTSSNATLFSFVSSLFKLLRVFFFFLIRRRIYIQIV